MRRSLSWLAAALATAAGQWHDAPMQSVADFEAFRAKNVGFVVLVYAPWCGHSRALLPEVEKAASTSTAVPFFKVDGTEAEALATKLDVKGYPTLLFVRRGDGPPMAYEGVRQSRPIADWALARTKPTVQALASAADVQSWAKSKKPVGLVLFASAGADAETEALAAVSVGTALPCATTAVAPTELPELSSAAAAADGPLTPPLLVAFTSHADGPLVLRAGANAPLTHASMLRFGRAAVLPPVVAYAPGDVEEQLFEADVPLHLLYLHSKEAPIPAGVSAALASAGATLRGTAAVATVDVSEERSASDIASYFDVGRGHRLGLPALLAFSLANGTNVPPHIRSQPEPAASSTPLVELVGSTFRGVAHDVTKDVLVQFYSPTCGHCAKLRPVYDKVAAHFAKEAPGEVVVAQIDAVANDVLGLEIAGFPTIILYPKGNGKQPRKQRGVEYDGSRDWHDLIQFVNDARAGRKHIGGLPMRPGEGAGDESPDEDDGYRVEL